MKSSEDGDAERVEDDVESADADAPLEIAGRYRVGALVGRGASASVYAAKDLTLDRPVALKIPHPELADSTDFVARFRREGQSAASLNHANVLAVHDSGEEAETPYLVMEFLSGGSLRSMLNASGSLEPAQVINIGLQACRALNHAHGEGLVHRDIKPDNLLFDREGNLRVADFGLARAISAASASEHPGTEGGGLVGTARYASPEQASNGELGSESDIYSLGLVLIEALTGEVPLVAESPVGTLARRANEDVEIPDVADVPEGLIEVLAKMTDRDTTARPDAAEAGAALVKSAEGLARPEPLPLVLSPEISTDDLDATNLAQPDPTQFAPQPVAPDVLDDDPPRRWPLLLVLLVAVGIAGWFVWDSSFGPGSGREIPNLVGRSAEEAVGELGNYWVLDEKFDRDPEFASGEIIRTDPAAGEKLDEGEELRYWVSLGLPLVSVPTDEIVGRSRAQAELVLEQVQLTVGDVDTVNDDVVPAGFVISVEPDGAELSQGEAVDLLVSLGPADRAVPALTEGTTVEDFQQALIDARLIGVPTEEYDDDVPAGQIVSATPEPGEIVAVDSMVDYVISLGPEPVPIPNTAGLSVGDAFDRLVSEGFVPVGETQIGCPVIGTDPPAGQLLAPGSPISIVVSSNC